MNVGEKEITLEKTWLEVSRGGAVIETVTVNLDEALAVGELFRQYETLGLKIGLDVVFGARNILEPGEALSLDRSLSPREGVLISDNYLVVKGSPDRLAVVAVARDVAGGEVRARGEIEVRGEKARNEYIFLETDHWYVLANIDPGGHHRFTQTTEFALDATIVDGTGSPYRGDGRKWEDWYAFGKKVLAAADGEVARVVDGTDFPIEALSRATEETWPAYLERIDQRQLSLFLQAGADPLQVAGGEPHFSEACEWRVLVLRTPREGKHSGQGRPGGETGRPHCERRRHGRDSLGASPLSGHRWHRPAGTGTSLRVVDHLRGREVLSTQKPVEPGMFYWLKREGFPAAR